MKQVISSFGFLFYFVPSVVLAQAYITGSNTACSGETKQYFSSGYTSYSWSVTGGGTIIGSSTNSSVSIQWTSNGTVNANHCYWVDPPEECYYGEVPCDPDVMPPCYGLICDDPPPYQVCEQGQLSVSVSSLPAQPTFSISVIEVIPGGKILTAANGTVFQWLRDDQIIPGATGITHLTTTPGSYKVRSGTNGCFSFSNAQSITGNNQNFTLTNSILIPGITTESQLLSQSLNNGANEGYVAQSIIYSDNLGKNNLVVNRQASPDRKDILQPHEYDNLGRVKNSYLPIVANQSNGFFVNDIISSGGGYSNSLHSNFYNSTIPGLNENIARDSHPFAQDEYEASPMSRIVKQGSFGSFWQIGGENKKISYGTNSSITIRRWTINETTGLPEAVTAWPAGSLVRQASDEVVGETEKGTGSESYADLSGLKIVDRAKDGSGYIETYYVYDNKGNLRFLLPPALIEEIGNSIPVYPTADQLNRLAWQYQYDVFNRVIASKTPDTDWSYVVYDKRDRPVLTQDGNQRLLNQWSFIKYDEFDRPVISGLFNPTTSMTRQDLQNAVNAINGGKGYQHVVLEPESIFEARTGVDITAVQYDGYREYRASNSISLKPGFSFAATTETSFRGFIGNGTNQGATVFPSENIEDLTFTYYDSYKVNDLVFLNPDFQFINEAWNTSTNDTWEKTDQVQGLVTGQSVKVLGSTKWLHTVTYYDKRSRPIQVLSSTHLENVTRTSSLYDFSGKVLETQTSMGGNYDITWQSLVNTSVTGTTLTKTAGSNSWNAGASSVQVLPANTNGYVETTVTTTDYVAMLGLSDTDPDAGISNIDYGFMLNGQVLEVYENGAVKFTGQAGSLATGDVLRIQRLSSVIYYLKNGKVVYISAAPSTSALLVDVSIYSVNGTLSAVRSSFTAQGISFVNGTKLTQRFQYDHAGRLLKTWHRINLQPEVLLSSFEYNQLGELIDKKIHSTNGGVSFLQSIDYRYNIKSWLTSINGVTVPDAGETDYFAMELAYHEPFVGSDARFDGLISTMKWKNDLSTKERLYSFNYDDLKRLKKSDYKARISPADPGWNFHTDRYTERNLSYDKSGNIKSLQRFSEGEEIDDLDYKYGTPGGNQLKAVIDGGDPDKGFVDGNHTQTDYVYDANGNLVQDLNKGIISIVYNHLDLPQTLTFADNSYITYTYDAGGIRLAMAYYTSTAQQVFKMDYVDEFVYLNNEPIFIFHGEGRIVPPSYQNLVANKEANGTEGFTASGSVTVTAETQNGQTYVKAVCNTTSGTPGIYPIGNTYNVSPGEKYSFKVLGYRATSANAYLKVTDAGSTNIVWTGALLPQGSGNENWVTTEFIVPPGVTQIKIGVLWSNPALNETFYINRVALYKVDWEYQYFLTDHLGSTRVVLGTDPTTVNLKATFETEAAATENQQWLNLDYGFVVPHVTANATPGGNEVVRMNNTYRVGPARSMKVFPGDVVNAQVMAYYTSGSGFTQAPLAAIVNAVASVLVGGSPAVTTEISNAYTNSNQGNGSLLLAPYQGSNKPSAFLNYILFDEEYKVIEAKSSPVGAANVLHAVVLPTIQVKELGYLFVYLSYDNESAHWVHFDELSITHMESPVLQVNAYYPFGMMAYTWLRDGEKENLYGYQNKEYDSLTRWHDFHARQYDAALGRWFAVDPQNQFSSPYVGMSNIPVMGVDPDGEFFWMPIIAGALMGGVMGAAQADMNGGNWLEGFLKGAFIGAVSGALGQVQITGVLPGIAYGASTGAAVGAGQAILFDSDVGEGALYGAAFGGFFGGISGGMNAHAKGKNILTGGYTKADKNFARTALMNNIYGIKADDVLYPSEFNIDRVVYGSPELQSLSQDSGFPKMQVARTGNLPAGNTLDGALIRDRSGNLVGGLTNPLGPNGKCNGCLNAEIFVAPKRFDKAYKLFLTLGHELGHAKDFAVGNVARWNTLFANAGFMNSNELANYRSEVSAHTWSYNWARQFRSGSASHYRNMINHYRGLLPFFPL
jgi:RHS repeat-associated protein